MRSSEIDSPAKEQNRLDNRTAISSEEKTTIRKFSKPTSLQNTDKLNASSRVHRPLASGTIASDDGQDLLSLPAKTLGVCSQPRQEPFSEQTPVVPAVGIIRQEDEERFRMHMTHKGRRMPPGPRLRKNTQPRSCLGRPSSLAASFSVIRANLLALGLGEKIKTLAVTSLSPGDGKTTVAINLAVIMAQEGMDTLLAGVGIKKISFAKAAGTKTVPGLADAILGRYPVKEVIHPISDVMIQDGERIIPEVNNLHIMTGGTESLKASEGIDSKNLKNFVEKTKKEYDIVIFDTSPSSCPFDPLVLEKSVDAVLLVCREGHLPEEAKNSDMQRLRNHCNIIGMVINYVRWEEGKDFLIHVKNAEVKQEATEQMHDSNDAHKELAKITRDEKSGYSRFLLWSLILVVIAVIALWLGGILSIDKVQDLAQIASKEKGPALPERTIKQPIDAPGGKPGPAIKSVKPDEHPTDKTTLTAKKPVTPSKEVENTPAYVDKALLTSPEDVKTASALPPIPTVHYPYSLHMGSFKTQKLAAKSQAILSKKGLTPYWTVVDLGEKGVWYRIFVGHFKTWGSADVFQTQHGITADRILKTGYSVQIGLYSSKEKLDQQYSLLRESGYCPYIINQPQDHYQLLVGAFQTKKAAENLASRLKASGMEGKQISR